MANIYSTSTDCFNDLTDDETYVSSTDTKYATAMTGFITAASRLIDGEVGRWDGFFYPSTDEVTRYYNGNGCSELEIDEFASISAIGVSEQGGVASTDYTTFAATDYFVEPYNYAANGKPIKKIVIDVLNGTQFSFFTYRKGVKVTGISGYSLTPPDVVALATRMQAIRWFMRAKQGYQDSGANVSIGGMTFKGKLELDPDVKALLWPLKLELS